MLLAAAAMVVGWGCAVCGRRKSEVGKRNVSEEERDGEKGDKWSSPPPPPIPVRQTLSRAITNKRPRGILKILSVEQL